ncbi:hypothetical protein MMC11_003559 [Xylographa trunciseda]|nr:hypothetical protein [Xylographa trunciseda]
MPSHVERTAIRWLLRAALLGTIAFAIWGTLSSRYSTPSPPAEPSSPAPHHTGVDAVHDEVATTTTPEPAAERGNALVVVSLKEEKVDWLDGILPDWERNVYVVDGDALEAGARLRIPKNKGREGMAYLRYRPENDSGGGRRSVMCRIGKGLTAALARSLARSFIIDNYDRLPNVTLFLHSARYQWHNDDPEYDGVPILQNLRLDHVHAEGYANLRCGWTLGCPAEIQPGRQIWLENTATGEAGDATAERTEKYYTEAFAVLFPGEAVPDVVGVGCCAQFATTRSTLLARPLSAYVRHRDWLLHTPLPDAVSGRILEYSWHLLFGKPAVHCPPAADCYCATFGYCNLTCPSAGACDGRYALPPYSTMPQGWPRVGWNGEVRGGG